jgi:anti-sigma factor RsiW
VLSPVPNTDCDRAREGASARLDGELGQLDQARLEAHLALCAECREFAAGISAAAARIRQTPLEAAPTQVFVAHRRSFVRPRVATAAAATLLVAAAAGSSFFLGQQLGARSTPIPGSWQCCGAGAPGRARTAAPSRSSPLDILTGS